MSVAIPKRQLFIGGRWVEPVKGGRLPVINPSTEEEIGTIPAATPADVDAAVSAAQACVDSGEWTRSTGAYRAKILHAIADKVCVIGDGVWGTGGWWFCAQGFVPACLKPEPPPNVHPSSTLRVKPGRSNTRPAGTRAEDLPGHPGEPRQWQTLGRGGVGCGALGGVHWCAVGLYGRFPVTCVCLHWCAGAKIKRVAARVA